MRRERLIAEELSRLPAAQEFEGISDQERLRRVRILHSIQQRIIHDGPHRARVSANRGHLFMPFAALKGYDELVFEVEQHEENSDVNEGAKTP